MLYCAKFSGRIIDTPFNAHSHERNAMNNNFYNNGGYQYDNPFTNEPQYDFYDELIVKDARKATSRSMLSLVLYMLIGYAATLAIIFGVQIVIAGLMNDAALYERIASSIYYQLLISTLPMYAFGIPVVLITLRKIPKKPQPIEKPKMRFVEWLVMIPIAEAAMLIGSYIGTYVSEVYSFMLGVENNDTVSDLIAETPLPLLFVITVILAPIFEELIFRKLLLDRLSVYGSKFAIIVTAVAFGLFHGNFDQLFYAALVGVVLGYVAIKSGNWLYSVGIHMVMNFIGGILPVFVNDSYTRVYEWYESADLSEYATIPADLMTDAAIVLYYFALLGSLVIGGVVLFVIGIRKRWFRIDERMSVRIPKKRTAGVIFRGVGTILFLVMSGILIMIDLFKPLLEQAASSGGMGV